MRQQIIVTIGREYGSGGHYIAQQLAARLGIRLYDRALIDGTVKASGYQQALVDKNDEKPVNIFLSRRVSGYSNSIEENVAEQVFSFLRGRAEAGESFVVVGRCSDSVLRHNPNALHFFILADKETKVERIVSLYHLSEKEALDKMLRADKKRRTYHNYYSDMKWGDSRGYDLCVNSGRLGIEQTIDVLLEYIRRFQENG
ncbi:MAG: cytidylate kinase-like family protein [Faecalibacterium sp.]|jgi:cytidylate kinase|nr:cytidylate kinase-like family protein [Faecalibacterium sp.]